MMPSGSSGKNRSTGRGRPTPTVNNHYVPEWYQKRFLVPGQTQFRYLDLRPDRIVGAPPGTRRKALMHRGPAKCFAVDHLYSIRLGQLAFDMIEQGFFKDIDDNGKLGCETFSNFSLDDYNEEGWHGIMAFMDAQRWRTPRGLAHYATLTNLANRNALLLTLERMFQMNSTMWTEGIWEIVKATDSKTKFLLTDNPVTFYNSRAFPGSPMMVFPNDAELGWVGTRTIFPLDLDTCLIITHREFTRDPWKPAMRGRANARAYAHSIFNLLQVQTGRALVEDEVLRINLILKRRADRYIAACDEEWLYPERRISTSWSKLDDDWFLLPNLFELHLGGAIFVGYKDGSSAGWDEYGYSREHPKFEKREKGETRSHRLAQREWGVKRLLRSVSMSNEFHKRDSNQKFWDWYVLDEIEDYLATGRRRPGGASAVARIRAYRSEHNIEPPPGLRSSKRSSEKPSA